MPNPIIEILLSEPGPGQKPNRNDIIDGYAVSMNVIIPLLSLIGPIYFGLHGSSIFVVLIWAVIWTALRFLATWKSVYATLQYGDGDGSVTWLNRHPYFVMLAALVTTLIGFIAVHTAVYWIVRWSFQYSN
jgi:hypothetical protein